MGKILVIGSSNTDLIARVSHLPAAGETLQGSAYQQAMGGKGANQAMAAHRAGGDVSFITSVGDDSNGDNAIAYYRKEGLDVSESQRVAGVPSGIAMIWVDDRGENSIVIIPGANNKLSPEFISTVQEEIAHAEVVMLQMEIPYETIKAVCRLAGKSNTRVVLNAAPAVALDQELLGMIDILIVNETEAEVISGVRVETGKEEKVAGLLLDSGVKTVILTLGKRGSLLKSREANYFEPAYQVQAVDTTAAGDTFCGAMVAEITRGHSLKSALKFATAAAAICVTRMGAQPSVPTEEEIHEFIQKHINH